jgi:hypothetical protein
MEEASKIIYIEPSKHLHDDELLECSPNSIRTIAAAAVVIIRNNQRRNRTTTRQWWTTMLFHNDPPPTFSHHGQQQNFGTTILYIQSTRS